MSIPSINSYALPAVNELPANRVKWHIDSARAVLLIHDMQDYFLRFYGENNSLVKNLLANIVAIRTWAKSAGIPVVYTAQPNEQTPQDRALLNDMWGPGLTTAYPKLKQVVSALTPDENDTVLVKWRYSAFQRSPLQDMMKNWQRDQLIIVGVYAHIGCLTTALDAFMRDIKPFMVADAVADFTEAEHSMALNYVAGRCGSVVTTDQVIGKSVQALSREWLTQELLQCIDEDADDLDADDNLIDYGLDSVRVMGLIGKWEKLGINVQFEELAREPSINGWWALIQQKLEQRQAA